MCLCSVQVVLILGEDYEYLINQSNLIDFTLKKKKVKNIDINELYHLFLYVLIVNAASMQLLIINLFSK